jgi:hypothetical protein
MHGTHCEHPADLGPDLEVMQWSSPVNAVDVINCGLLASE